MTTCDDGGRCRQRCRFVGAGHEVDREVEEPRLRDEAELRATVGTGGRLGGGPACGMDGEPRRIAGDQPAVGGDHRVGEHDRPLELQRVEHAGDLAARIEQRVEERHLDEAAEVDVVVRAVAEDAERARASGEWAATGDVDDVRRELVGDEVERRGDPLHERVVAGDHRPLGHAAAVGEQEVVAVCREAALVGRPRAVSGERRVGRDRRQPLQPPSLVPHRHRPPQPNQHRRRRVAGAVAGAEVRTGGPEQRKDGQRA